MRARGLDPEGVTDWEADADLRRFAVQVMGSTEYHRIEFAASPSETQGGGE